VKASLPVEALSGWVRISLPKLQTLCPLVPYWLSCRSVLAAFWSLVESASTMVLFYVDVMDSIYLGEGLSPNA
jgi:hypothetical protein